jgi:hypothetical protein
VFVKKVVITVINSLVVVKWIVLPVTNDHVLVQQLVPLATNTLAPAQRPLQMNVEMRIVSAQLASVAQIASVMALTNVVIFVIHLLAQEVRQQLLKLQEPHHQQIVLLKREMFQD